MKSRYLLLASLSLLVSCITDKAGNPIPPSHLAPGALDSEAKEFIVDPGKASIYIIRRRAWVGIALDYPIVFDGSSSGSLEPNTYQFFSVLPGEHLVAIPTITHHELGGNFSETRTDTPGTEQKFTIEAGKSYFLDVSSHLGLPFNKWRIEIVSEEEGRKLVMSSHRVETTSYP